MTSLEQYSVGINIIPTKEVKHLAGNVIQIPGSNQTVESNCLSNIVAIHKRSNIMLCQHINCLNMEEKLHFMKQQNKYKDVHKNGVFDYTYRNYGRPMSYTIINTYETTCQSINKPIIAISLEAYNIFLVIRSVDSVTLNFFNLCGILLNGKYFFNHTLHFRLIPNNVFKIISNLQW